MKFRMFALILIVISGLRAHAQEGTYEVIVRKQQEKQASRWSLADWLTQKQNNRISDLVLAKNAHSSSLEVFFGGESYNYTTTIATIQSNHDSYAASAGAYLHMFGITGGYESDTENRTAWTGAANLRLIGRSL